MSASRSSGTIAVCYLTATIVCFGDAEGAVNASRDVTARVRGLRGFFLADPEELSLLALVDLPTGGAWDASEHQPGRAGGAIEHESVIRNQ